MLIRKFCKGTIEINGESIPNAKWHEDYRFEKGVATEQVDEVIDFTTILDKLDANRIYDINNITIMNSECYDFMLIKDAPRSIRLDYQALEQTCIELLTELSAFNQPDMLDGYLNGLAERYNQKFDALGLPMIEPVVVEEE